MVREKRPWTQQKISKTTKQDVVKQRFNVSNITMLQLRVKRTADANWMKLFGLKNQTRIKNFRKNTTGVKDQYRETEKAWG